MSLNACKLLYITGNIEDNDYDNDNEDDDELKKMALFQFWLYFA